LEATLPSQITDAEVSSQLVSMPKIFMD